MYKLYDLEKNLLGEAVTRKGLERHISAHVIEAAFIVGPDGYFEAL